MKVHRSIENLPIFKNAVITIGTFDGVHEGHKKIIEALNLEAKKINGESVIITFDPHPRKIIHPSTSLQLINSLDERIYLLSKTAIDHLVIVPFTKEFSELSAEGYIKAFLISYFKPSVIIIGYDHHFGKGRLGNFSLLLEYSKLFNYQLQEISKHVLDANAVSSTKIRKAIWASDISTANKLLGYTFFFEGKVIKGDQLGRKLGYPTANLEYTDPDKIHLGHGVYAVLVTIKNEIKKGMMSIGNRPTLEHSDERVEVNIFDFDKEIYGQILKVTVIAYIRAQEKYNSLDELKYQLSIDKENSIINLKNLKI